jgi:quercetin dioxygenase-like cupin family protein
MTNRTASRLAAEVRTFDDFQKLRADWAQRAPIPKIVADRSAVGDIQMIGQDTKVLLSGDEGSGRCVVFNYGVEPGYRAPPHHQPSEEEIFMVVEGTLRLTVGNETRDIPRGGFGFIPRYATHGFVNVTQQTARTVTINSPAGHERGFEMVVREAGSEDFLDLVVAHGWRLHEDYTPPSA